MRLTHIRHCSTDVNNTREVTTTIINIISLFAIFSSFHQINKFDITDNHITQKTLTYYTPVSSPVWDSDVPSPTDRRAARVSKEVSRVSSVMNKKNNYFVCPQLSENSVDIYTVIITIMTEIINVQQD